jgi:hypothetical protein
VTTTTTQVTATPNAAAKLKVSQLATPATHWFVAVAPVTLAAPKGSSPRPSVVVVAKAPKTLYVGSLRVGVS